jgi:molecular chaperone GrpE
MTNDRDERAARAGANAPDGTPGVEPEQEGLASLRGQLEEERNRAQGYFQSWQRTAADFQNYKRRVEEDRQKNAMFANLALIMNILPIFDDLDHALGSIDANTEGYAWLDGFRQIQRKFQGALDASGVKEIPAEGSAFDPNLHEAIAEGDGEPGKITKVVRKGYTMGDRVIRPAMVIVGR